MLGRGLNVGPGEGGSTNQDPPYSCNSSEPWDLKLPVRQLDGLALEPLRGLHAVATAPLGRVKRAIGGGNQTLRVLAVLRVGSHAGRNGERRKRGDAVDEVQAANELANST